MGAPSATSERSHERFATSGDPGASSPTSGSSEDGEIELADTIGLDLEDDLARWIRLRLERGS